MNISIFGLGYVGCVSIACLAENGHTVTGVDVVPHKIDLINAGKATIIEKDIDILLTSNWEKGRISASQNFKDAVLNTEISIICVGTPSDVNGHLNLNAIYQTAEQIGEALKEKDGFHIAVIRSTVLPGTNQKIGEIIAERSGKKRNEAFAVVSNPEFLREGSAVKDYYNPPVTVIGTDNEKASKKIAEMYKGINAPVKETNIEIAELIKYVNNSFHALKVSFANEVGNICKKMNIDSHELMNLFCMDTQLNLSPYYLKPGFAFGGSCLPKDLKAFKTMAHDFYLESPVLNSILDSNENQKNQALNLVLEKNNRKIGILGLSFKKGTDDLRYSPIVELAESLLGKGFSIAIYDKNVNVSMLSGTNKAYIDKHIPHLSELISDDLEKVINDSETIVISHNEPEFKDINLRYADKHFIDLVKIKDNAPSENYEGICW
ncbi:nucleotide sugar dehydrogenase [Zobellia galactanivorans]|uniref:UDP-glucose 6-dehydrogenase n=1 Tax=Zobellia galactanivorans (strain DSM 12802 / CCUG 47099 / CIP 106680 / NCIMB 13871 / Dsij) TaxID=63186 RepID=G0L597_ZOBGA|nr:nucleotide sugar dehydrogenase [Zobellia galactanivorans]MDO6809967.1 nucleotide sugar dehydrogenase [Zobellia galactanivorans]CAZ96056.1 GDP-mannose 6-dehydrogenase [Zobellia galactanivorans]